MELRGSGGKTMGLCPTIPISLLWFCLCFRFSTNLIVLCWFPEGLQTFDFGLQTLDLKFLIFVQLHDFSACDFLWAQMNPEGGGGHRACRATGVVACCAYFFTVNLSDACAFEFP